MNRERSFTRLESIIVDSRSDYSQYGKAEVFLDGAEVGSRRISPESMAAKLLADLVIHLAKLNAAFSAALISDYDDILEHLNVFLKPLTGGDAGYLRGAATPDDIFFNMLEWDERPADGLSEPGGRPPDTTPNNCFIRSSGPREAAVNAKAAAAYLTFVLILDIADIRHVAGEDAELDTAQMFRCLSHLVENIADIDIGDEVTEPGEVKMRKLVFVAALKRLSDDGIARTAMDSSAAPSIH